MGSSLWCVGLWRDKERLSTIQWSGQLILLVKILLKSKWLRILIGHIGGVENISGGAAGNDKTVTKEIPTSGQRTGRVLLKIYHLFHWVFICLVSGGRKTGRLVVDRMGSKQRPIEARQWASAIQHWS